MKILLCAIATLCGFSALAGASVKVTTPAAATTVTSPVQYVATATAPNCSRGVASIGIYVNNKLAYVVKETHLNTTIALQPGAQHTVVEEWDWCGSATYTTIDLDVAAAVKPTVSVNASPTAIDASESSSLNVVAANAVQVTLTGTDGSSYTLSGSGGTQTVSPPATTTYTATAIGQDATTSAAVTLTVHTAPTVSLSASPSLINAGGSSTLTVAASNASKVTLSGSNGSVYTFGSSGGTTSVHPSSTTIYTAVATGQGGKSSATSTVEVTTKPIVSISASPNAIAAGTPSTLSVTASDATQVLVSGSNGTSYSLGANGGSQPVAPTVTTTYTAVATGSGGSGSASTVVTVYPAPTVSIGANPASVTAGHTSTLVVSASNATQVTVTGSDGKSYVLGATGGSQKVSPVATTLYTATAGGPGGKTSAATSVTVVPAPTVTISANPPSIAPGGSSLLTVTATNALQLTLTGSDGSVYPLSALTGGTQSVSPTSNTTYTAVATGAGGSAVSAVYVTIAGAANVFTNLQADEGWESWGQIPPHYKDCSPCSGVKWSMTPGITSPSLSGNATQFSVSGTKKYAGVLFTNPVIGQYSTQDLPDKDQLIVPTLHNFTLDTDFYVTDTTITQALEFDVAMYLNGSGMFWGTQCVGNSTWDVVDNVKDDWAKTGIPCEFVDGWNHLTLQFQRLPGNVLLYSSVTLNGVTTPINMTFAPRSLSPNWYGVTVDYQMDMDKYASANTTYLDNLSLTYW